MQRKPIIKLELTRFDKFIEKASLIFFAFMWLLTIYAMIQLPQIIPTHFNFRGVPDAYGDKMTLLILPIVGTFVFALLTWLNRVPHIFNYLTPITVDNARQHYTAAAKTLRILRLTIIMALIFIIVSVYKVSTGSANGLSPRFLFVFIFIMLAAPGHAIVSQLKKGK